jgi:hypothetical protein
MSEQHRNSQGEELRDTGRLPKFTNERKHMASASAFDTLATTNLTLIRWLKVAIAAMVLCSLVSAASATYSTITIRIIATNCR